MHVRPRGISINVSLLSVLVLLQPRLSTVKMIQSSQVTKINHVSIVLMRPSVRVTPNVNGTAQQPLLSTVNQRTPVSLLKMNVVRQTLVKHPLHQKSKKNSMSHSSSVMLSTVLTCISDTRLRKQVVLHQTPTSHLSSLLVPLSNTQLLSTPVLTR
jgi:hypothetical protein